MRFKFNKKNILITYHPVTLERNTSASQFKEILLAVSKLKNTKLIFTYPNSDTFGRIVINMIKKFTSSRKNDSIKFSSMGHINYLSVLKNVDCVFGKILKSFFPEKADMLTVVYSVVPPFARGWRGFRNKFCGQQNIPGNGQ